MESKKSSVSKIHANLFFCLILIFFISIYYGCDSSDSKTQTALPDPVVTYAQTEESADGEDESSEVEKMSNVKPKLKPIGYKVAYVCEPLEFDLTAIDDNRDGMKYYAKIFKKDGHLSFRVSKDLIDIGAELDENSGHFSWTSLFDTYDGYEEIPDKDYLYEVEILFTVKDDGDPPLSDSEKIRIRVYDNRENLIIEPATATAGYEVDYPSNIKFNFTVTTNSGYPVPDMDVNNFKLWEDESPLHPTESNLTAFPSPENYDFYVLLSLDLSGSIAKPDESLNRESLNTIILAAKDFIDELIPTGKKISLNVFSTKTIEITNFTNDRDLLFYHLDRLEKYIVTGASTNLYGAFVEGITRLNEVAPADDNIKVGSLVVFSDGKDTAGMYTIDEVTNIVNATEQGHDVYTIAVQSEDLGAATLAILKALSGFDKFRQVRALNNNDTGGISRTTNMRQQRVNLITQFRELATDILWSSSKYYTIQYCTPSRTNNPDGAERDIRLDIIDTIGRKGTDSSTFIINDDLADGCYDILEEVKFKYYDFDGDGFLSKDGANKDDEFVDCNDTDPDNYNKCDSRVDGDSDGYCGSGCNVNSDSDDTNASVNPNMISSPNYFSTGTVDNDGDGFSEDDGDCNDNDRTIYPGALEFPGDDIIQDCSRDSDGKIIYFDDDGDGFTIGGKLSDCDDSDPDIYPVKYYRDVDGDGYGDASDNLVTCNDQPDGYVTDNTDCDDDDPEEYPAIYYRDADGDGYGDAYDSILDCPQPNGYVTNDIDCDDGDAYIPVRYYEDADGDGEGDIDSEYRVLCPLFQPDGWEANNTDCDDTDPLINFALGNCP